MRIKSFFDPRTSTLTYVVSEPSGQCVVIDPVIDFDPSSGRVWFESAEAVSRFIRREGLEVAYVLDTHAHADHLTGLSYFRENHGARTAIGARIVEVQAVFRDMFNLGDDLVPDGSQFDLLLKDGETVRFGMCELEAIATPGHTPACMSFRVQDALFVGDTLFQPDYGTARCDFPGGSAGQLYDSICGLYERFPRKTRTFTCHDYQPGGRAVEYESTIGMQVDTNIQLNAETSREQFVHLREERDASLPMPALIIPAIQVNIRAGVFPPGESNGVSFLKYPLNLLGRQSPKQAHQ
jgi:glyoxylase-like metal-dependent hydrolase (beta-lactamase superfamily II)